MSTIDDLIQTFSPVKDKLYRFALRIVGKHAEAEDVVQEVLIKTWKQQEQFDQVNNQEGWLMQLTKNLSIDKIRSKHQLTAELDSVITTSDKAADPFQTTEAKDSVNLVKQIILMLPEKQQQVIHLRDIEGYSYKEIAEITDISMDQVKVNLFRARKTIREEMLKTHAYGLQ